MIPPEKKPAAKPRTKLTTSATPKRKTTAAKKKKKKGPEFPWKALVAGALLILLSPFYYGYIVKFFASAWQWVRDIGENPEYRTYHSFDIRIPRRYSVHGIDVSYAQGKIDWRQVKAMQEDSVHITFAFIKATEGMFKVDPYFKRNWREAPKVGIVCGAYHYFRPRVNGTWQARFFLQNVDLEPGDLPMVVDVETLDGTSPATMRKELTSFLKHIEARTHAKPIIYSGISFYQGYLKGYFDDYSLWIAHYYQPKLKLGGKSNWQFWQHSDRARVNGINHVVDFDAFKGDSASFRRMLIH